jgi:hypothetical protein
MQCSLVPDSRLALTLYKKYKAIFHTSAALRSPQCPRRQPSLAGSATPAKALGAFQRPPPAAASPTARAAAARRDGSQRLVLDRRLRME